MRSDAPCAHRKQPPGAGFLISWQETEFVPRHPWSPISRTTISIAAEARPRIKHSLQPSGLARLPNKKGADADNLFRPQARSEARAPARARTARRIP